MEHFLDGDRDLERRRDLAADLAATAPRAASRALCDLGYGKACLDVADYHLNGKEGLPANPAESFRALHAMCDAKDKDACSKLIQIYKFGKAEVKDSAKGEEVKTKACAAA